ncbi:hypothetical protein NLJ89_g11301 [Agrocybe chaxingu]|uniref:Uncharacterized protein n=1 Tax=Agrocybe chaxingu TaxID=84603 RepID=A0A9W8JPM1_9AGAR|nr:hypothetical protein NLJ89_g11301 [Agrocybe chaxingu]
MGKSAARVDIRAARWYGTDKPSPVLSSLQRRVLQLQRCGRRFGDSPEGMRRDVQLKRKGRILNIVYCLNVAGDHKQRREWVYDGLAVSFVSRDWGLVTLRVALNGGEVNYSSLSTPSSPSYETSFDFDG